MSARTRSTIILATCIALAACSPSPSPEGPKPHTPAASGTAAPTAPATPGSVATALPGDHARTGLYRIAIAYPPLPPDQAALLSTLHARGDTAKREFMRALPDVRKFPQLANRQFQLLIDFTVAARTPAFVSVREKGMSDTGGAHPQPINATFVYAIHARKVIALDDLFSDPVAARQRLSTLVRNSLEERFLAQAPGPGQGTPQARRQWTANMRQMLEAGTRPTPGNFSQFIVNTDVDGAPGLTLIFPPYQVAPYVFGTQTVDVSAIIFGSLLKPQYRDAFAASADKH